MLPFVREATPQIRDQIRPFARIAGPYTEDLGAAAGPRRAQPDLTTSFNKLNRLFNIGAYNPRGAEGLTGDLATRPRARGGLPLRARVDGAEHRLVVQHRDAGPATADLPGRPRLRHP